MFNIIKFDDIFHWYLCSFSITSLSISSLLGFFFVLFAERLDFMMLHYCCLSPSEILWALWKCCVSLERHLKTSDHKCSRCLDRHLQVACVCPQTWQRTTCLSISVHQLKGQWIETLNPKCIRALVCVCVCVIIGMALFASLNWMFGCLICYWTCSCSCTNGDKSSSCDCTCCSSATHILEAHCNVL